MHLTTNGRDIPTHIPTSIKVNKNDALSLTVIELRPVLTLVLLVVAGHIVAATQCQPNNHNLSRRQQQQLAFLIWDLRDPFAQTDSAENIFFYFKTSNNHINNDM